MASRTDRQNHAVTGWGRALLLCVVEACGSGCATLLVSGAVDPNESAAQGARLVAAVEQALRDDGRVDASRVQVLASGSVITLSGSVASGTERGQAIAVAAGTAGVSRVIDRLTVGS